MTPAASSLTPVLTSAVGSNGDTERSSFLDDEEPLLPQREAISLPWLNHGPAYVFTHTCVAIDPEPAEWALDPRFDGVAKRRSHTDRGGHPWKTTCTFGEKCTIPEILVLEEHGLQLLRR